MRIANSHSAKNDPPSQAAPARYVFRLYFSGKSVTESGPMSHPTVSILIPCHNAEKYIGETLESVFRQTWPAIEVIVVDDGSEDNSIVEVQRFDGAGIRLIRQKNKGAGAARNRAYGASRGEFVQFLDADDLLDSRKIELQMLRIVDSPRCVASSEWGRFYHSPEETLFDPEPGWRDLDVLDWLALSRADGLGMLFPALWLVPRAIADAAGTWDESLSLGDDGEYFTRVLLAADRVLFCSGARCHYRSCVPGSLSSRKSPRAWASAFRVVDLCESHVRMQEDTERMRCAFAISWQHLAHAAYPYDNVLAEQALARARALHAITIRPDGGALFKLAARLIGWRNARRLQVVSGRA
jgi:glycosyltransferase involved in cell wall biosynthesis